jgi:hypothetical protein
MIGFIEHLYTQLVATSNYSAIINSQSEIHYKTHLSFSACHVFTILLITASNVGRSPSSVFPKCPPASATSF